MPGLDHMCYDCKDIQAQHGSDRSSDTTPQGQLIKVGNDLFRILELHHLTPGNLRAHMQCQMRNIRTLTLAGHQVAF